MSGAATPDTDAQNIDGTGNVQNEPTVEIHLSGPVEFTRSISDKHDLTATHEQAVVDGTVTVDEQMLFEIAPPTAHLSVDFILRKLFGHEDVMVGYQPVETERWELEFQATVQAWKKITNDITTKLGHRTPNSDEDEAQRYLSKLEQASLLGESGLLTILELAQIEEVSFTETRREELLNVLAEISNND